MRRQQRIYGLLTRWLYGFVAASLTLISLAMIGLAGHDIWRAAHDGEHLKRPMLDAIGLVVVSLAVFDVAKYLMEEEVLRDRELRSASEARETLTKFMVIIVIAMTLESLVFVLGAAGQHLSLLVYPAILLGVSSLMVVSLALYLRLSSRAERSLGEAGLDRNVGTGAVRNSDADKRVPPQAG
jgi:hypothetical protein